MILEASWSDLAALWQRGDFGRVHDWLGERWNRLIQERPGGHDDRDAAFLQGLAFAALAFHFTQQRNPESARIFADDALRVLARYAPSYEGVRLEALIDAVRILRSRLEGPENEAVAAMEAAIFPRLEVAAASI